MKNVLLVVLFMIGVVGYSVGKNVRLHGSLKEFGTNVVSMDFDGAGRGNFQRVESEDHGE